MIPDKVREKMLSLPRNTATYPSFKLRAWGLMYSLSDESILSER